MGTKVIRFSSQLLPWGLGPLSTVGVFREKHGRHYIEELRVKSWIVGLTKETLERLLILDKFYQIGLGIILFAWICSLSGFSQKLSSNRQFDRKKEQTDVLFQHENGALAIEFVFAVKILWQGAYFSGYVCHCSFYTIFSNDTMAKQSKPKVQSPSCEGLDHRRSFWNTALFSAGSWTYSPCSHTLSVTWLDFYQKCLILQQNCHGPEQGAERKQQQRFTPAEISSSMVHNGPTSKPVSLCCSETFFLSVHDRSTVFNFQFFPFNSHISSHFT